MCRMSKISWQTNHTFINISQWKLKRFRYIQIDVKFKDLILSKITLDEEPCRDSD